MVPGSAAMEAHDARTGHDGIQLPLLATGRELFLECHDSITARKTCHQAVAGEGLGQMS
ncbi:MAG: hypothetical protein JWP08_2232 [Bryobacterales bacterium]|nr:hypothetical protein [Bryobacterales bacterium]